MYLSIKSSHKLNEVVLNFEVAYRSFIAESMIKKFPTELDFKNSIETLAIDFKQTSLIFSHKYSSKIMSLKKDYAKNYKILQDCNDAYKTQTVNKIEAPFVSTLNDYIVVFYNNIFYTSDLLKGISPNDFYILSDKFHSIRNDLFHPASCKILLTDAKEITQFVRKVMLNIDISYFWYVHKDIIEQSIQTFIDSIESNPITICNLDEIGLNHQKIVCRDNELNKLREFIFGKPEIKYYRTAGSVAIYGYGGLGKTALVVDFLIDIIKESIDKNNPFNFEFLLFFTSKEEELIFSKTSGEIMIREFKKQVNSFDSFKKNLFEYLSISTIDDLSKFNRGIIVVDNIETLTNDDKNKVLEFIKSSPPNVQYILTSRYEENADERLHLEGFSDKIRCKAFLEQFENTHDLSAKLDENGLEILLDVSKGNTLILVLSLQELSDGITTIEKISDTFGRIKAANIEKIVDFMYKNTFDNVIQELEKQNPTFDIKNTLTVISLYNEPIDLFTLSELANDNHTVSDVEKICDYLTNKLVLQKKAEFYELNEFASKFVLVKFVPDKVTATKLHSKISEYKFNTRLKLRKFEEKKSSQELERIMNDWKPRTEVEKIAIVNVFSLYAPYASGKDKDVERLKREFAKNESKTTHPYIKFQKAKIFEILLKYNGVDIVDAIEIISDCYEDVIYSIEFEYKYIKFTESFANVLRFYGQFLVKYYMDHQQALAKFEQSKILFQQQNWTKKVNYKELLKTMIISYKQLSKTNKFNKKLYNQEAEKLVLELRSLLA